MNYNWLREEVLDQLMKQAILRKVLHVDADRNLHIKIPIEMGDEFGVIVLSIQPDCTDRASEFEQLNLDAYSASTEASDEEDAMWEKYVKA